MNRTIEKKTEKEIEKDIEKKLEHFRNLILEEASLKKEKAISDLKSQLLREKDLKYSQYLEKAYLSIQKGIKEIDREKGMVLSVAVLENRTRLLEERNEIVKSVIGRVKDKLEAYTKTEAYKEYLFKSIKTSLEFLGDERSKVFIRNEDAHLLDELKKEFPNTTFKAEDKEIGMLGGSKAYNSKKKIFIDKSFDKKLKIEEDNFLENRGLEINFEEGKVN